MTRHGPLPCCAGSVLYVEDVYAECVRCGASSVLVELLGWTGGITVRPVWRGGRRCWSLVERRTRGAG